jgi:Plasma-membrane choline transporter
VTFAAYWISEVIKNVVHATIAGVYGSWFFCSHNMPSGATRGALRRTMTYSFGSISLGSLLVAVINFFRQLCSIAQQDALGQSNILASVMFCLLQCFLGLLDWVVEFINRYAFVTIALYGKSYFAAAKDTWTLIKNRGIDILVNLCLISPVLSLGAFFVGFSTGLFAYLYLLFTKPEFNSDGTFTGVILFFAFIIGLQLCNIFTTPLAAGIDTIFVASAWDPEVLMREHPDLYAQMLSVYPPLANAINV